MPDLATNLLLCVAVCGFAWRRRRTPEGAFALGVCGSATVYMLSYFAVGVASDFRYGYWAVLAAIAGAAVGASADMHRAKATAEGASAYCLAGEAGSACSAAPDQVL